jgi:UDP:flavonoid glycosyltransferase YjiC (YdhE family)
MRFIISALGSAGDVHPMLGLGTRLRDRGHHVTLLANEYFQDLIAEAGIDMVPVMSIELFQDSLHDPDLWHPMRGPLMMLRDFIAPMVRPIYEAVAERYVPGETIVCAHSLDYGSRIAHEKLGVPLVSIHYAPVVLRSTYQSPKLPPMLMGDRVPRTIKALQYWMSDVVFVDRLLAGPINDFRRELSLPPVRRPMHTWAHSPQLVVCLFPEWFASVQPDWPPGTVQTSFPLWDAADVTPEAPDVEQFLAAGDPPIVFAPGSANAQAEGFFRAAVEACRTLGRRGMLLTKFPEQLPQPLPPGVAHFAYVPFGRVLSRAAALVHHGGAGTLSQGLAAGVPHLVMPMAYDQHDNADRLRRLGVARVVRPHRFKGPRVARELQALLDSREVAERCRHWAGKLAGVDGLGQTCDILERFAAEQPLAAPLNEG